MTDDHSKFPIAAGKASSRLTDGKHPVTSADGTGARCLLYLFGELSSDEETAFERELSMSAVLADELALQSKQVSLLYECPLVWPQFEPASSFAMPSPETFHSATLSPATSLWRYAALLASIAASVGLLVVMTQSPEVTSPSEDLKIAQTWAASETTWASVSGSRENTDGELAVTDELSAEVESEMPGPFGDETVPSWMLAALDNSSDLLSATLEDAAQVNPTAGVENL